MVISERGAEIYLRLLENYLVLYSPTHLNVPCNVAAITHEVVSP